MTETAELAPARTERRRPQGTTPRVGPRPRALDAALIACACLAAALPAIVSTARGIAGGAVPNGDRAIIALRAYDVFTSNTPLVGQFSASSLVTGHTTHSPGPLLYWLLSIPSHIGPAALALTMGLVNALACAGAVLLARRRGGIALMLATAAALALMCRSLAPEVFHDVYNPSVGVVAIALLIFLCWSIACGERRLLPVSVLVASFAAQAELTFLLPAVVLMAIALVGLALAERSARRPPGGRWPWYAASGAVGVACWSAPLVDQAIHSPGNLALIIRAALASKPTLGTTVGWHAVVRAIGIPPWWLMNPRDPFGRGADVTSSAPGTFAVVTAVAILCALVAVTVAGAVRRRRDVTAAGLIALALCAALASIAAATPTRPILAASLGYTLWWGSPAGMWAWLALGWCGLTLWRPARVARMPSVAPAVAASAAALAVGVGVAAGQRADQDRVEYRPIRAVFDGVRHGLPARAHTVRIAGSASWTAFDFRAALMYDLRRRGLRPLMLGATKRIGARYEACGRRFDGTIDVWDGQGPRRTAGRLLVRVALPSAVDHTITVTYSTDRFARSSRCT